MFLNEGESRDFRGDPRKSGLLEVIRETDVTRDGEENLLKMDKKSEVEFTVRRLRRISVGERRGKELFHPTLGDNLWD